MRPEDAAALLERVEATASHLLIATYIQLGLFVFAALAIGYVIFSRGDE